MLISQYFHLPGGSTAGFEVESPSKHQQDRNTNIFTQAGESSLNGFLFQLSLKDSQFLIVKLLAGWNGLPGKVVRSTSLAVFKGHIDVIRSDRAHLWPRQGWVNAWV